MLGGGTVRVLDEVDSTQSALARLARAGAPEGTVVAARHQTAGRGRRGHQWWDAPGQSVLCSVLLRPPVAAAGAPELTLVGGIAITDVLEAAQVAPRIRWPNDVLVGGRKICGVLAEAVAGSGGQLAYVLLGFGVNVAQEAFPAELADRATSLRLATGRAHDPGAILVQALAALERRYGEWCDGGFAALRDVWRARSATIGQRVSLPDGRAGVALDVDAGGALLVDLGEGGVTRVVAGEVGAPAVNGG